MGVVEFVRPDANKYGECKWRVNGASGPRECPEAPPGLGLSPSPWHPYCRRDDMNSMTRIVTSGMVVTALFLLLAFGAFAYLITSQCGSSSLAGFFSDAGAWFTSEGC